MGRSGDDYMIEMMKKFFSKTEENGSPGNRKETFHDVRIATCALFLEMAKIDGEFSDAEQENIVSILKEKYDLSDNETAELIQAAEEELKQSIDFWQFTKRINEHYSEEEKNRIVEMLWKIVYTDGTLDKHENYLVGKLSNLLHLSHEKLIEAKLKILHGGE